MSPTIVSLIIMVLANFLPSIGIPLGTEQLTPWIETTVTLVTGLVVWIRHVTLKKQLLGADRVNALGGVKKKWG